MADGPEVWRSTTQGLLGPAYSRKSTMAMVSTQTRKTMDSLRYKSRAGGRLKRFHPPTALFFGPCFQACEKTVPTTTIGA